jgi:hypothetical protein
MADDPVRFIKNVEKTFHSLTAQSTSNWNVVLSDVSELIVSSTEAILSPGFGSK